jgi:hypothetical protein
MSFYSRIASDDTIYKYVEDEATNVLPVAINVIQEICSIRQFIIAKELQGCNISVVLTIMQRMAGLQESRHNEYRSSSTRSQGFGLSTRNEYKTIDGTT